jgi:hypothetical protein
MYRFNKFNKKLFSQSFGNCVRFTSGKNEIKIPLNDKVNSVFYKNDENISSLKTRISLIDKEFIQKLEIRDLQTQQILSDDTNVNNLINKPFEIFVNNYHSIKHFPSLNQLIVSNLGNNSNTQDPTKNYLHNLYFKDMHKRDVLLEEINRLKTLYEKMNSEYKKGEELVDKNLEKTRNNFMILGIIYFLIHFLVFYFLIYHVYSWDNIEPITYITGNAYWIVGLFFFIITLRRLDLSFVFSDTFTSHFLKKFRFIYATHPAEKQFFNAEIREINKFLKNIRKIKH